MRRETTEREQAWIDEAVEILLAAGWSLDYRSGPSVYMTAPAGAYPNSPCKKWPERVRISDHHVPETDERRHARENGGWSWSTHGWHLVCDLGMTPREAVEDMLTDLEDYA